MWIILLEKGDLLIFAEPYKHKCWRLEHPNNAVVCTRMSFSRYKQTSRASAKRKGQPLSLDGF